MKWLERVRDRFSAAYCESLRYLSDFHILKKDPALSLFVSTDSFSLHFILVLPLIVFSQSV